MRTVLTSNHSNTNRQDRHQLWMDPDWHWLLPALTAAPWGCISAWHDSADLKSNLNDHRLLGRTLRRLGAPCCLPALGISEQWGRERSYLVLGISTALLLTLGNEFKQECIITSDGLVFCDGQPTQPLDSFEARVIACRKDPMRVQLHNLNLDHEEGVTLLGKPPVYAALIARLASSPSEIEHAPYESAGVSLDSQDAVLRKP